MDNILISGGAGYIGSFAARLFISKGYNVTILDNLSTGHKFLLPKEADFIEVDLLNKDDLKKKLSTKRFSGLIHFAAKALVAESVSNPDLYYNNNISGSLNLFQIARETGIDKIIFSSTAAVYGEPVSELSETHIKQPVNPYGHSKLAVERYLQDASQAYNLKSIALRYFNACGAYADGTLGEIHNPETHLIPLVVGAALKIYPTIKVYGADYPTTDGSAVRDYIHVEDLASAHLCAYEYLTNHKNPLFDVFNVGTGKGYSVLEIINVASGVIGNKVPHEITDRRCGDPAILVARVDKIQNILKWKAEKSELTQIITSVTNWMNKNRSKF